ncbi:MAG: DNA topoisomerase III [Zoogloeaceae bacterium]|jgi:DNA topoisomerase-3|nr:DNA topoisomerase III [Zoogloeaceae bacterium]
MGKKLIIAEKPSVAADIARALGNIPKHGDYFENDDYIISSAVGHLLEIACPEEYEVKRGKWSFIHLPVIPPYFDLRPIEKSEPRLRLLIRLIKSKDVESLINACDAGREGELIFSYIVQHSKTQKPVRRLWLQSMTQQAIRDGFHHLRSGNDMQGLADAAICRSESDWLVGINGTRAMTAFNSKTGGFHLTTVGRVQTPTLAIVVEREKKIRDFKPRPYWEVEARFSAQAGEYTGKWFDEKFKGGKEDEHARAERLWEEARAEAIRAACQGQTGEVSEEAKPESRLPPALFDLTSLQREANARFGFSAKTTLSLAQALYEKHKVLTYPRTDSRCLPEDYPGTVKATLAMLTGEGAGKGYDEVLIARYAPFAHQVLARNWVLPNRRIFNNAKISDHFAIIPTTQAPRNLSEIEQKLYDFVVKRFLAVFFPAAEYQVTTRITRVADHPFKSEGKVLVQPGWLAVYGREQEDDAGNLPPVAAQEKVAVNAMQLKAAATRPPPRYSEATLLSAMEGAGKMVEDEELKAAMAGRGLGTPATRAQIIENLIAEQYMLREGRELVPTAKAFSLLTLLTGLGVNELTAPELTGEWEWKLGRIEKGNLSRQEFMREIAQMTQHIVERAKSYDSDTIPGDFGVLETPCPKCGGAVRENYKKFQCAACDFSLWKIVAGRQFEPEEIETLLTERKIGPLTGFRNKMGRPFAAIIRINDKFETEFDFGQPKEDDAQSEVDFSAQESLGKCPKCGGAVYEYGNAYVCERSVGAEKSCNFRSGKVILLQPVEPEQMRKLLTEGRTDLLKEFVSARTRRKFSAFLAVGKDGKVGFEFEKREPKTKAGASAKKKSQKAS